MRKHFVILAVNTLGGEDEQTVQNFVQQNHLTYPIVMDDQQQVGTLYHVREVPTSYFLDSEGIIRSVVYSPVTLSFLEHVLTDPKKANGMTQGG
jgi:peroxiredoxin